VSRLSAVHCGKAAPASRRGFSHLFIDVTSPTALLFLLTHMNDVGVTTTTATGPIHYVRLKGSLWFGVTVFRLALVPVGVKTKTMVCFALFRRPVANILVFVLSGFTTFHAKHFQQSRLRQHDGAASWTAASDIHLSILRQGACRKTLLFVAHSQLAVDSLLTLCHMPLGEQRVPLGFCADFEGGGFGRRCDPDPAGEPLFAREPWRTKKRLVVYRTLCDARVLDRRILMPTTLWST